MTAAMHAQDTVRHFRHIMLWPLQIPLTEEGGVIDYRTVLKSDARHPWRPVDERWLGNERPFSEELYAEFVSFLPYVQRFLYGEAERRREGHYGEAPMRVFGREDVASVRVMLEPDSTPVVLRVERVQLNFFYDIDVVILAVEVSADDVPFEVMQDLLFRVGRAYPAFWEADGQGGRCAVSVEWLGHDGAVLARSDYENRARYLASVAETRTPCVAAHWEWLLRPMIPDYSTVRAALRYRELEYYRMPLIAYLAFEEPAALSRADFINLGLVTGSAERETLPASSHSLENFEAEYCYDRYWAPGEAHRFTNTRFICTGHTFLIIGKYGDRFFSDGETGMLAQFRGLYYLLGVIVHFHKAALLMLSDRQELAIGHLDVANVESVKRFKRRIRRAKQTFLRFTHRYWFHEVSTQDQATRLFRMWSRHLDTDRLFAEVREEIHDMSEYLDSDSIRRQANTVIRLTVVTTLGLIATIATGFLGMNIFDITDKPWQEKVWDFTLVLIPTTALILFTVFKSKSLSDFLEALSEARMRRKRTESVYDKPEPEL